MQVEGVRMAAVPRLKELSEEALLKHDPVDVRNQAQYGLEDEGDHGESEVLAQDVATDC